MTTVSDATETTSFRSPADVIEVTDGVKLHHLHPTSEETYPIPIVLVPSLLSKWYVFDLHPQRSRFVSRSTVRIRGIRDSLTTATRSSSATTSCPT